MLVEIPQQGNIDVHEVRADLPKKMVEDGQRHSGHKSAKIGDIRKTLNLGLDQVMTTNRRVSASRRTQFSLGYFGMVVVMAGVFLVLRPASAQESDEIDARKAKILAGKTAWQADDKLRDKWMAITGRFIFHRACLDCHQEGTSAFTRQEWQRGLQGFPGPMHPQLPEFYSDLTAMFGYGRMVPDDSGRLDALTQFILQATSQNDSKKEYGEVNLFPAVGEAAPAFEIKDSKGLMFQLKSLQGKKNLVLVFSRAHW